MEKVVPTARVVFNRHELAGAFGDLGTVLPLIMGMIAVNQLGFGSVVPVLALYARSFGVSQSAIGLAITVAGTSSTIFGFLTKNIMNPGKIFSL